MRRDFKFESIKKQADSIILVDEDICTDRFVGMQVISGAQEALRLVANEFTIGAQTVTVIFSSNNHSRGLRPPLTEIER